MWWMEKVWSSYHKGEYEGEIARSSYFYPRRYRTGTKEKAIFLDFLDAHQQSPHCPFLLA